MTKVPEDIDGLTATTNEILNSVFLSLRRIALAELSTEKHQHDADEKDLLCTSRVLSHMKRESLQETKSLLMTLHLIFPHEFLPALDILDRKMITKFVLSDPTQEDQGHVRAKEPENLRRLQTPPDLFHVLSTSSRNAGETISTSKRSRYRNAFETRNNFYEVRIDSWHCSCPAFAFSVFNALMDMNDPDPQVGLKREENASEREATKFIVIDGIASETGANQISSVPTLTAKPIFGGHTTLGNMPIPVCKHILAVALAISAPSLFCSVINVEEASMDKIVAWTADWNDHV